MPDSPLPKPTIPKPAPPPTSVPAAKPTTAPAVSNTQASPTPQSQSGQGTLPSTQTPSPASALPKQTKTSGSAGSTVLPSSTSPTQPAPPATQSASAVKPLGSPQPTQPTPPPTPSPKPTTGSPAPLPTQTPTTQTTRKVPLPPMRPPKQSGAESTDPTVAKPTPATATSAKAPAEPAGEQTPTPSSTQTEMKPPAVLTALSSMSSNKLPRQKDLPKVEIPQPANSVRAATPLGQPVAGSTAPGLAKPGGPELTVAGSGPPNLTPPPAASRTPQSPEPPPPPKLAKAKKSPLRFLPLVVGGILLLVVTIFVASTLMGRLGDLNFLGGITSGLIPESGDDQAAGGGETTPQQTVTLEYWGLWEPKEVMEPIFRDFETQNPGISVQYVSQSYRDYRERLQTAIASQTGPDVFRFHASWTPMLVRELAPLPSNVLTATDFESAFYPVAKSQLTVNDQILGVPLMYDGLLLYYNTDMFQTAGLNPPTTWSELRQAAATLAIREGKELARAGVALGTTNNVEHFSDIIALLMLQNGAELENPNTPEGRDALLFYTNFVTKDQVWSDVFPSSTVAFARGEVAMMLAPSWRAFEVQSINPDLKFATAPVPQLADSRVAWASYWAEGVNLLGEHQQESWKLVQYLTSSTVQKQLYAAQAQIRSFGEPYARRDLADELASQPLVAPLLQDAPYARGWYMSSYTHDNGLNDQIIKYYQDAVNAISENQDVQSVLRTLNAGVQQVLIQYNLSASSAQPPV